jgi:hypothetical protein
VDIDPRCKELEKDMPIKILIGDQCDINLYQDIPDLDIIVDDGGHTMIQQNTTFNFLFPRLKPGGVYLCEDTHTSYWAPWGGGLRKIRHVYRKF